MQASPTSVRRLVVTLAVLTLPSLAPHGLSAQANPSRAAAAALDPDTVFEVAGGPRVVVLDAPGSPVVALRLFVPVEEGPSEAGAAEILRRLAEARVRGRGDPVGVDVLATRTPSGLAYTVTGPVAEFDYLAHLLRVATQPPEQDQVAFLRARNEVLAEVLRAEETAAGRVAQRLRDEAAPGAPPLQGTSGTLETMTLTTLRDVWARSHAPEDMTLVLAGDVPREVLLAGLETMGSDGGGEAPTAAPARQRARAVQVIRHWYGEAHLLGDATDPRAAVAGLLVAERLRERAADDRDGRGFGYEAQVQLWEIGGRKALAVVGAAYPRTAGALREEVRGILAATGRGLEAAPVERAVARLRAEFLLAARTPAGRAQVVGRHMEADGEPGAALRYLLRLEDVDVGGMRAFLSDLSERTVRAELRP